MAFYVKITGKENEIEINKEYIEKIEFRFDSPDETQARANDNNVIFNITGKVNDNSCKVVEDIFKWAVLNIGDVYRKVEIQSVSQDNKVIRYYTLTDAFIVDYTETFGSSSGEGNFILKLKQKGDKLDKIEVNSQFDFEEEYKWLK